MLVFYLSADVPLSKALNPQPQTAVKLISGQQSRLWFNWADTDCDCDSVERFRKKDSLVQDSGSILNSIQPITRQDLITACYTMRIGHCMLWTIIGGQKFVWIDK